MLCIYHYSNCAQESMFSLGKKNCQVGFTHHYVHLFQWCEHSCLWPFSAHLFYSIKQYRKSRHSVLTVVSLEKGLLFLSASGRLTHLDCRRGEVKTPQDLATQKKNKVWYTHITSVGCQT